MKILYIITTFLLITKLTNTQMDCVLGARVYPYKYIGATQTVEFRIYLQSNCYDFPQMLYFILPYSKNYRLDQYNHPQKAIIEIKKRSFEFNFSDSKRTGYKKFFNIIYNSVNVKPSGSASNVDISENNLINFQTNQEDVFSKREVRDVLFKKNPVICDVINGKSILFCKI